MIKWEGKNSVSDHLKHDQNKYPIADDYKITVHMETHSSFLLNFWTRNIFKVK